MVAVALGLPLGDLGSSYFGCRRWDWGRLAPHVFKCVCVYLWARHFGYEPGPPLFQQSPCHPPLALPADLTAI